MAWPLTILGILVGCDDDPDPKPCEQVCTRDAGASDRDAGTAQGDAGKSDRGAAMTAQDAAMSECACESVPRASRRFVTEAARSCNMASPLTYRTEAGETDLVSVAVDGLLRGFDPASGEERWRARLPAPEGRTPIVLSTPAIVGQSMFLAYQETITEAGVPDHGRWVRERHVVVAFDLEAHRLDDRFAPLTLQASHPSHDGGTVTLDSRYQLLRSAVQHVPVSDREGGLLYVSLGNGPSLQPFHGWVFELDLDAWAEAGSDSAITGTLLTTRETDCRSREGITDTMVCGGGVWTPSGLLIAQSPEDDVELFVPTGNGRIDYDRQAYAHSVLRTGRGLGFETGCDRALCADFDELDPSPACLASCKDIFTARLPPGDTFAPAHGKCEGRTFVECYGRLDADLGSSSPVLVSVPDGPRVIVQPGKDGALYLVDADHLGTLYQRVQALTPCGTKEDKCPATWTGNFVTTPLTTRVGQTPVVIVSGFNFDATHSAGLLAYAVEMVGDAPRLRKLWQAPEADAPLAFRFHAGRPFLFAWEGAEYVGVVETTKGDGILWLVRITDGLVVQRLNLGAAGLKYSKPLVLGDRIVLGSCGPNALRDGRLLAFDLTTERRPVTPADRDAGLDGGQDTPTADASAASARCEPGGRVCEAAEHCDREQCGGPGICRPRPATCDMSDASVDVCGCDGRRYPSSCHAHAAGTSVDPEDLCE